MIEGPSEGLIAWTWLILQLSFALSLLLLAVSGVRLATRSECILSVEVYSSVSRTPPGIFAATLRERTSWSRLDFRGELSVTEE